MATAAAPAAAPSGAPGRPVRRLTVLYDAHCPLCVHIRHWLLVQPRLVPLDLVPAASHEARRRFPQLDHAETLRDITVVGDSGQLWRGTDAFIVCLWALTGHRPRANWLATPAGRPFARAAMYTASAWRQAVRTGDAGEGAEEGVGRPACDDHCPAPR
ncbi:DCC1-like thiol-disulfide oxidoreductase family protein [Streptomyces sp. NPDC093224]|uniref:thiol-disulfide oxidoreductase DCC family protein n=1 Tax=Streptomyces sp. NPDC093224 TaxID=3155198 RepID=UPI00343FA914